MTDQIPRISVLDPSGALVGRGRGAINGAHGLSGDRAGNLYLAELAPEQVTKLALPRLTRRSATGTRTPRRFASREPR